MHKKIVSTCSPNNNMHWVSSRNSLTVIFTNCVCSNAGECYLRGVRGVVTGFRVVVGGTNFVVVCALVLLVDVTDCPVDTIVLDCTDDVETLLLLDGFVAVVTGCDFDCVVTVFDDVIVDVESVVAFEWVFVVFIVGFDIDVALCTLVTGWVMAVWVVCSTCVVLGTVVTTVISLFDLLGVTSAVVCI